MSTAEVDEALEDTRRVTRNFTTSGEYPWEMARILGAEVVRLREELERTEEELEVKRQQLELTSNVLAKYETLATSARELSACCYGEELREDTWKAVRAVEYALFELEGS